MNFVSFIIIRAANYQSENDSSTGHAGNEEASAAVFAKYEGIDGEARDADYKEWIDSSTFPLKRNDSAAILSTLASMGDGTSNNLPTRRRGDVVLEDVAVVKEIDKCDPKLAESVCQGKVFPKVDIHVTASYTDAGRVTYYAYELKNVQVVSYNISGQGQAEDVPTDNLTLNYEEIKVTYTENDKAGAKKGNIEYSWKVEKGE